MDLQRTAINQSSSKTEDLIRAIVGRKLIAITGAGFSRIVSGDPTIDGHKIASWDGLLRHGYHYCITNNLHRGESTRAINVQFEEGHTPDLIGAAQTILGWLDREPGKHRRKWLESSLGRLKLQSPELVEALKTISPVLATLNYEDLIEQGTSYPSVDWRQYDVIARVIRRELEPHVIHLHGFWKEPESIVADHYSYRDLCKNIPAQNFMTELFVYHRLLFVGCRGTFEDPNFSGVINYICTNYPDCTHKHYVLCQSCDLPVFKKLLKGTKMLEPLSYGNKYDDLLEFLQRLGKQSGATVGETARALPLTDARMTDPSLRFKKAGDIWRILNQ
jgi:hypothetical protein